MKKVKILSQEGILELMTPYDTPLVMVNTLGESYLETMTMMEQNSLGDNFHLDIQVVEVVASGSEVKESAIGHQRTCLDLQLLDQTGLSNKSWRSKTLPSKSWKIMSWRFDESKPGGGDIFVRQERGPCQSVWSSRREKLLAQWTTRKPRFCSPLINFDVMAMAMAMAMAT